jgi:hypothetical protein
VNQTAVLRIHKAVDAAKQAAHQARLDACDVDDLDEVIEGVDRELEQPAPNKNTLTLFLNSIAKSLAVAPSAEGACREIDRALRLAGLPVTWNQ